MSHFVFSFAVGERVKFELGNLSATTNARSVLSDDDIKAALKRHLLGDWGALEHEDKAANEAALRDGSRLVSRYTSGTGVIFYIITEADRSLTTILLPEDY
jgi:hypothetical protein